MLFPQEVEGSYAAYKNSLASGWAGGTGFDPGGEHAGFPAPIARPADFYPVLCEDYAIKIARDWNVPLSGAGFVMRFEVREDLPAFNDAIVGESEIVAFFL